MYILKISSLKKVLQKYKIYRRYKTGPNFNHNIHNTIFLNYKI